MITRFLLFFAVEAFAFFIATLNYRYCAKGYVGKTIATDMMIAANGFFVIRLVSEAESAWEMLGYVLGAAVGSYAAMWWTKGVTEQQPSSSAQPTAPSSFSRS